MTTAFRVHALPAELLDRLRVSGVDDLGNAVERLTAAGGEPVRCCLRDAEAGEALLLFGYQPPLPASPYRETGAVYAHAEPCAGRARLDGYPPAWRGRPQVLRAYDDRGWIHDARVHDGHAPETVVADLLADPAVVRVHSRNVAYGCFMFTITRS
ncbi:DUF1203 domain-containing protein [Actinophytocola gossypii]|uniref:DUF1203 domain-containing protein n=1 Tax=Actinophytocola gossypii TaxID=2812003 RepID=A0ABT2JIB0_9PSEU|nr:DUF1203 domain-containing protein [Actinophytocola gossypii]MCT2587254.1 DUF1203 domain-containing protein [Actinophytocola gossypii]